MNMRRRLLLASLASSIFAARSGIGNLAKRAAQSPLIQLHWKNEVTGGPDLEVTHGH